MVVKTIVVRGRVIRVEEGKIAEIFTLVLAGTVDEKWFENSASGNSYIEINEEELDAILGNIEIDVEKKIAGDIPELFRL